MLLPRPKGGQKKKSAIQKHKRRRHSAVVHCHPKGGLWAALFHVLAHNQQSLYAPTQTAHIHQEDFMGRPTKANPKRPDNNYRPPRPTVCAWCDAPILADAPVFYDCIFPVAQENHTEDMAHTSERGCGGLCSSSCRLSRRRALFAERQQRGRGKPCP